MITSILPAFNTSSQDVITGNHSVTYRNYLRDYVSCHLASVWRVEHWNWLIGIKAAKMRPNYVNLPLQLFVHS